MAINNTKISILNKEQGISMLEILVVTAILAVSLTGLLGLISFSLVSSTVIRGVDQAEALAQETVEQVRNFRDGTDWQIDGLKTLFVNTDYYPEQSGFPAQWQMILGTKTVGNFTKKVIFEDVKRDINDDIVEVGGANDENTKK